MFAFSRSVCCCLYFGFDFVCASRLFSAAVCHKLPLVLFIDFRKVFLGFLATVFFSFGVRLRLTNDLKLRQKFAML